MTLRTLLIHIRGSVNTGILAGNAALIAENERNHKNTSKKGRIIGAAVAAIVLILIIVLAVCYDRSKKRKARQGTQLRETREGDMDEEARPMVLQPAGVPNSSMAQPSGIYYPPHGEGVYVGSGYAQSLMHGQAGHQGTQFYRNQ
jgi:hypothetical protein